MMRSVAAYVIGVLILATFCMCVALLGRAGDWSPFALVMVGAVAGMCVGVGFTIYLVTGADQAPDWCDAEGGAFGALCDLPYGHPGGHATLTGGAAPRW